MICHYPATHPTVDSGVEVPFASIPPAITNTIGIEGDERDEVKVTKHIRIQSTPRSINEPTIEADTERQAI